MMWLGAPQLLPNDNFDGDDECDNYGLIYIYGGIFKTANMVLAV